MSVVCVCVYLCILSFSCIRCNRYTVTRLKARSSDNLLFGFSVKPPRCSTAPLLEAETPDIIGRRHPKSKSVPVGDWLSALWMVFMRLRFVCLCVRVCV